VLILVDYPNQIISFLTITATILMKSIIFNLILDL